MDIVNITDGLLIGSQPASLVEIPPDVSLFITTSVDFQPRPSGGPTIIFCPLTDDAFELVAGDKERAAAAATQAASAIKQGRKVLVTCRQGLNRSGLVCALTLVELGYTREDALSTVQSTRPGSIYNWFFRQLILGLPSTRDVSS